MTEEDAKTKWCPFTRCEGGYVGGQPTHNRYMRDLPTDDDEPFGASTRVLALPSASYCIASACMAWRPTTALHAFDRDTGADLGRRSVINATREEFGRVPVGGYCGLAGS